LDVAETAHDICQDIQNVNINFLFTALYILSRIINNLAKLILKRGEMKTKFYLLFSSLSVSSFPSVLLTVQVHSVNN
jgi:hypothetical protein